MLYAIFWVIPWRLNLILNAYKIQMLGNYREESIQHSEHGESLKSWRKSTIILNSHRKFSRENVGGKDAA